METEVAQVSLYTTIGYNFATMILAFTIVLGLYRIGRAFHRYIYTGEFDRFENTMIYCLIEDHKISKHTITGTYPPGIILDCAVFTAAALIATFAWPVMAALFILVGAGYLIRQRIAKKQEFVAKLDGSHPDVNGSGADESMPNTTQTYVGSP